jgi:hypothetical protein
VDSTAKPKKTFVIPNTNKGYTMIPSHIYDLVIGSSLPVAAKMLVLIVHRYAGGYNNKSVFIENAELKVLLPIERRNIPYLVEGLVALNILKGGAVKSRKPGTTFNYELSINWNYSEWDISYPSRKRQLINKLHERAIKFNAVVESERANPDGIKF